MTLSLEDQLYLQKHLESLGREDFLESHHPKQVEYIRDNSKKIAADWGRRSGKTTANGVKIISCAEVNPAIGTDESIIGYMSTTKSHAKRLMWGRLQTLSRVHNIGMEFQHTELIAKHPNGCQVWILGADTERDWDRLRGFPYRLIIIDEAQAIRGTVDSLINEVLDPALADYAGQLALTGTPNATCSGFFYEAATGQLPGWSCHHATVLDNPYFPAWRKAEDWRATAEAWLEAKREQNGWDVDHPSYLREWKGRWTRDLGSLVYKFDREINTYTELPSGYEWTHVMGVDFGHDDPFAMHVWAFCDEHPDLFSVDSYSQSGLDVTDYAELINEWITRYKPIRIVADTGALGKAITKEIQDRHAIPLVPAEKSNKFAYIELLNADLRKGKIKIITDSPYIAELELLQLDTGGRLREDPGYKNDICDAALYSYREAQHWINRPRPIEHDISTDDYWEAHAANLRKQRQAQMRRRRR